MEKTNKNGRKDDKHPSGRCYQPLEAHFADVHCKQK